MKRYFGGVFDTYTRVARIYPALISLAPIVWTTAAVASATLTENLLRVGVATIVSFGGIALLTNFSRSLGKQTETSLLLQWDGWPTTQFLRHRDATIDSFTKARYHAKLQAICTGLSFPSEAAERQDPRRADDIYRSATVRLLERRRGPEYKLLHSENAQYGFRRNLLGLKPTALFLVSISILVTAVAYWYPFNMGQTSAALVAVWLADVCFILVFVLLVRREFLRQAATEYALSLLRTLEQDNANELH